MKTELPHLTTVRDLKNLALSALASDVGVRFDGRLRISESVRGEGEYFVRYGRKKIATVAPRVMCASFLYLYNRVLYIDEAKLRGYSRRGAKARK